LAAFIEERRSNYLRMKIVDKLKSDEPGLGISSEPSYAIPD
jgi:hypothetical protein